MVYILTILIALFIVWNIASIGICMYEETMIIYNDDELIVKIAKVYWMGFFVLLASAILLVISYFISKAIICGKSNNDNKICIKK